MDEFLKLILTGERLRKQKRFNMLFIITALAETFLALPVLFIATPSVHAAASIVLGVLVLVFGFFNNLLSFRRSRLYGELVSEQIFADEPNADEESTARKALAEKYAAIHPVGGGKLSAALNIISVGFYLAAAVLTALINSGVASSSFMVPVLFLLGAVFSIAAGVISSSKDAKNRTELYEKANEEIAILKRYAGLSEDKILKQSYNAANTATRSQELFLCDPEDRAELRRIARSTGFSVLALAVLFVAATVVLGLLGANFDNLFMSVCSSCILAGLFGIFIAVAIRTEIRRRAVYRRNAAKLTDGEADGMRRFLQDEFLKLQRRGNIFFSLFCGIATLAGFILGVIGAVSDPEVSFIENVTGLTFVYFFASAILATVIWTVFYLVYRKKVKPVEFKLSNMRDEYGKTN